MCALCNADARALTSRINIFFNNVFGSGSWPRSRTNDFVKIFNVQRAGSVPWHEKYVLPVQVLKVQVGMSMLLPSIRFEILICGAACVETRGAGSNANCILEGAPFDVQVSPVRRIYR
jgi:hypothetical protein